MCLSLSLNQFETVYTVLYRHAGIVFLVKGSLVEFPRLRERGIFLM